MTSWRVRIASAFHHPLPSPSRASLSLSLYVLSPGLCEVRPGVAAPKSGSRRVRWEAALHRQQIDPCWRTKNAADRFSHVLATVHGRIMGYDSPNSAGPGPPDGANVVLFRLHQFTSLEVDRILGADPVHRSRFMWPPSLRLFYCSSRLIFGFPPLCLSPLIGAGHPSSVGVLEYIINLGHRNPGSDSVTC